MTEAVFTTDGHATIITVAIRMIAEHVRHMVVVDAGDVVGVVSSRDVFRVLAFDALEHLEGTSWR